MGTVAQEGDHVDYDRLLAQFRALEMGLQKRTQEVRWKQAEIVYLLTPGQGQSPQPGQYTLDQLAVETGYSARTLGVWRRMWAERQTKDTDSVSLPDWTKAYAEADNAGVSVRERWAQHDIDRLAQTATPTQKAQIITQLAADPDVQVAVSMHGPARAAINKLVLLGRGADSVHRDVEYARDPVSQQLDAQRALLELNGIIRRFNNDVERLLPYLRGLPKEGADPTVTRTFLEDNVAMLVAHTMALQSYLETGATDLDRFLTAVLKGD